VVLVHNVIIRQADEQPQQVLGEDQVGQGGGAGEAGQQGLQHAGALQHIHIHWGEEVGGEMGGEETKQEGEGRQGQQTIQRGHSWYKMVQVATNLCVCMVGHIATVAVT
jgi:hypothetical protein